MMKPNTQKLYELTVQANDIFIEQYPTISTSVGLMDQALRKQGIQADAVTVDAIISKYRLIFILLDTNTDTVGVGIGNTEDDSIHFVDQYPLQELTVQLVSKQLIQHLT